jgi:hypothetical protein
MDLKVVLIGSRILYYLLKEYEPEFGLLFKVTADFAEELPRSVANWSSMPRLIAGLQHREKLRRWSATAWPCMIEHSRRSLGRRKALPPLGRLLDLLREADYWAGARGQRPHPPGRRTGGRSTPQTRRVDQIRAEIHEHIVRGVILKIDSDGVQLAQVTASP